jgi:hypothetical protein
MYVYAHVLLQFLVLIFICLLFMYVSAFLCHTYTLTHIHTHTHTHKYTHTHIHRRSQSWLQEREDESQTRPEPRGYVQLRAALPMHHPLQRRAGVHGEWMSCVSSLFLMCVCCVCFVFPIRICSPLCVRACVCVRLAGPAQPRLQAAPRGRAASVSAAH